MQKCAEQGVLTGTGKQCSILYTKPHVHLFASIRQVGIFVPVVLISNVHILRIWYLELKWSFSSFLRSLNDTPPKKKKSLRIAKLYNSMTKTAWTVEVKAGCEQSEFVLMNVKMWNYAPQVVFSISDNFTQIELIKLMDRIWILSFGYFLQSASFGANKLQWIPLCAMNCRLDFHGL